MNCKLPKVSIVSTSYNKQNQIKFFLNSIYRQTYVGEIELIIVDDLSTDLTMNVVDEYLPVLKKIYPTILIKIHTIQNKENLGNCFSRNVGIQYATGEILIITDSDCLLSRNFIEAYVATYEKEDAGAVVSDFGIELINRDPIKTLERYEQNPHLVKKDKKVQDPKFPSSFLNTVTRGFSIKKSLTTNSFFDEEFGYTCSPESGFGWEDIEMGCSLYNNEVKISYSSSAFSIHLTHKSTAELSTKPLRALKNYKKLHAKHLWLAHVKKEWSIMTYDKIRKQQLNANQASNNDNLFLEKHLGLNSPNRILENYFYLNFFFKSFSRTKKTKKPLRFPEFLIIGASKGGTTSLYNYLGSHPNVCLSLSNELNYFTTRHKMGSQWYLDQFPSLTNYYNGIITGELSPAYLEDFKAPHRVFKLMPDAKILILLRNPVDLLYSNYQMLIRQKKSLFTFDEIIENELNNIKPIFLQHGKYAEHLLSWFKHFSRHQIMIIRTEDFEAETEKYFLRVQDFLRIPRQTLPKYNKINDYKTTYPTMQESTRQKLVEYYKPHNKALTKLLDRNLFWDY